ncbi:hypothetical protein PAXRUDRAFT_823546 [Paxillus rubicundulus Ve08.2h10]|uniref:Uncharacterized protein n=1 Tax=Paxillus rubicundulus Ve08.2h10 TaxID=930991 RepID=A0A0D0DJV3_9AGAM|nr:hypothetical protein PAXRUDRAFT_823546 [Paxillus rubicundulus Ve08.2h10]
MVNNASMILSLAEQLSSDPPNPRPTPRHRLSLEPCLPARLPSTAFLQREARQGALKAMLRQLRRSPTPPSSPPPEMESEEGSPTLKRRDSISSTASPPSSPTTSWSWSLSIPKFSSTWKEPQPFEVFRAIERKDIMFLMEVRDRAFPLLLRKTGDATPLLHAMRIGQSHRDVAIILLGAFSRWINHLEDSEVQLPKTRVILKALRTNLKLAIDYGLYKSQSDLIASFLQTLVMSEGDKWIRSQVSTVSLALRSGTIGKPVSTAMAAVRKFATKELSKADAIATLEDYVANATADLLLLSAWSMTLESIEGEQIPFYYFARDDRVFNAFAERFDVHRNAIQRNLTRRLKWQLRILRRVLEGRHTTYSAKIELLIGELDQGEGV